MARAPGGHKKFILTKLGGGDRIDTYIVTRGLVEIPKCHARRKLCFCIHRAVDLKPPKDTESQMIKIVYDLINYSYPILHPLAK